MLLKETLSEASQILCALRKEKSVVVFFKLVYLMSILDFSSLQHLKEISHFCKEDKGQMEKAMKAYKTQDYKRLLSLKMSLCFYVFLP